MQMATRYANDACFVILCRGRLITHAIIYFRIVLDSLTRFPIPYSSLSHRFYIPVHYFM